MKNKENKSRRTTLRGIAIKALTVATVVGCMFSGSNISANAQTIEAALLNKPVSTPTLQYLSTLSDLTYSDGTSFSTSGSSYNLESTTGSGANVITLATYDATNNITVNQNYALSLKNTTFGTGANTLTFNAVINGINKGTTPITFRWDEIGNYKTTPTVLDPEIINNNAESFIESHIARFSNYTVKDSTGTTPIAAPGGFSGGGLHVGQGAGTQTPTYPDHRIIIENSNFVNNTGGYKGVGGGIYLEQGTIEKISGNFINNTADYLGGAIQNGYFEKTGHIGEISGNFIGNKAIGIYDNIINKNVGYGGAITNFKDSTINSISGSFIGNNGTAGGAITNYYGAIENITGDFIGNYTTGNKLTDYGGAIFTQSGTIKNITGDFISNYSRANAGAIGNVDNIIDNITGSFINNKANYYGGAILNGASDPTGTATIKSLTGYFEGNSAQIGGAIVNSSDTGTANLTIVNSSFYNNIATVVAGAIYTDSDLKIIADNYQSVFSGNIDNYGAGAIYVASEAAPTVTFEAKNNGSFILNDDIGGGDVGAYYNLTFTGDKTGKVNLNNIIWYANAKTDTITLKINETHPSLNASAVFLDSTLDVQSGNVDVLDNKYTANYFEKLVSDKTARYSIDLLLSKEAQNTDTFVVGDGSSGIIYLSSVNVTSYPDDDDYYKIQIIKAPTDDIQLDYDDSKVLKEVAPVVYNDWIYGMDFGLATTDTTNDSIIVRGMKDLLADWLELDTDEDKVFTFVNGSDYYLSRDVKDVIGDSITITGFNGNTIHVDNKQFIPEITSTRTLTITDAIIENAPQITNNGTIIVNGGGLDNTDVVNNSTFTITDGTLKDLTVDNNTGATITADGTTITSVPITNNGVIDLIDSVVTNSTIQNDGTLTIKDDSKISSSNINNNSVLSIIDSTVETSVISNPLTITLDNSTIKDSLIEKDGTLKVSGISFIENTDIDNKVHNSDTLTMTDVKLNSTLTNDGESILEGSTTINGEISGNDGILRLKTDKFDIEHNISGQNIVNQGSLTNLTNLDLINNHNNSITMNSGVFNIPDLGLNTLNLNALNMNGGTLNIANSNVDLAHKTMGRIVAPESLQATGGSIVLKNMVLLSDSPNSVTNVHFAESAFAKQVTTDVHTVHSKFATYNVTYSGDTGDFTFTRPRGAAGFNPALYAAPIAATSAAYAGMTHTYQEAFNHMDLRMFFSKAERMAQRDANKYAIADNASAKPYLDTERNSDGIWFRPYAAYDSVSLRNGPSVRSFTYGSFLGGDSEMKTFKNGWDGVLSAYISYMGSHDTYNHTSIYQNGGTLGLTGTLYKDNFFTGVTLTSGASVAEGQTMFGHEDFPMLMAGVASKTGYNLEFKDGGYIIQPTMLVSYTFVNNFDYTNAAGLKITSSPLHAIQIAPNVKFIKTTKRHWQPYLTVGMRWNVMDKSSFKAENMALPEMSEKPYVEYGVGVQRHFKDNFCALGQLTLRNGGRNGIAALMSFKWLLGKDKSQKVEKGERTHTVIKEMSSPKKRVVKQLSTSGTTTKKI